jgi:hypothetical protein
MLIFCQQLTYDVFYKKHFASSSTGLSPSQKESLDLVSPWKFQHIEWTVWFELLFRISWPNNVNRRLVLFPGRFTLAYLQVNFRWNRSCCSRATILELLAMATSLPHIKDTLPQNRWQGHPNPTLLSLTAFFRDEYRWHCIIRRDGHWKSHVTKYNLTLGAHRV